jgi:hypothetical protein
MEETGSNRDPRARRPYVLSIPIKMQLNYKENDHLTSKIYNTLACRTVAMLRQTYKRLYISRC